MKKLLSLFLLLITQVSIASQTKTNNSLSNQFSNNIAYFTDSKNLNLSLTKNYRDITSQRLGNLSRAHTPAIGFQISDCLAQSNHSLTNQLFALRSEYQTAAFAKSSHGISLIENYWDNNLKPSSLFSAATHAQINTAHNVLQKAIQFDGTPKALENAMHLLATKMPFEERLKPVAQAWHIALQKVSQVIYNTDGTIKNTLTQSESDRLVKIHCEYLKSTTSCLAEWYDKLAVLSYSDSRYCDYLIKAVRTQNSILGKISSEGPLRGVDKLTSNVLGFCKTCTNWFFGSRSEHQKLHALERNSTNQILKSIVTHYNKQEYQAAWDYGTKTGIFKTYPNLEKSIAKHLPSTQTVSIQAISHVNNEQLSKSTLDSQTQPQHPASNTQEINTRPAPRFNWPYRINAPIVASLARLEAQGKQRTLDTTTQAKLAQSMNKSTVKEFSSAQQLLSQPLFVNSENQTRQQVLQNNRNQALQNVKQCNVIIQKNYKVDALSSLLAKECKADLGGLEYCFGNELQQTLHTELLEIVNSSAQNYYANNTSVSQRDVNKAIAQCAFVGLSRNQEGKIAQATSIANFCWSALELAQTGIDSIASGIKTSADYLVNVIEKIEQLNTAINFSNYLPEHIKNHPDLKIINELKLKWTDLKCAIRYTQGACASVCDLAAHPLKHVKGSIESAHGLVKIASTYIDYCDTLDSAHLLNPDACQKRLENLSGELKSYSNNVITGIETLLSLSAQDKAYLLGQIHGPALALKGFRFLANKYASKGFKAPTIEYPEYWKTLATQMQDAKLIKSYKIKDMLYCEYDNGAIFAGSKHGTTKKMWCVSPPKKCTAMSHASLSHNKATQKQSVHKIINKDTAIVSRSSFTKVNEDKNARIIGEKNLFLESEAKLQSHDLNNKPSINKSLLDETKKPSTSIQNPRARFKTVKETGEICRIVKPTDIAHAELIWAPNKWEEIRATTDDVCAISRNTGMPEQKINEIKKHLFYNKHHLARGYLQFDPDSEIASAWDRLCQGDYIKNDLILLEHEYYELEFEKRFNTTYEIAHEAAIKAGYYWKPPTLE